MPAWFTTSVFVIDLLVRVFFGFRILRRTLPVGVAWAWLSIILFLPLVGTVLYLFLGEYRLGRRRLARLHSAEEAAARLAVNFPRAGIEVNSLPENARPFSRAVELLFTAPLSPGNDIELLPSAEAAFPRMIADVDSAKVSCDMEFYIWSEGGLADEFGRALIRAARRGVACRVLLDQVGSARFLRSSFVKELRANGVQVHAALPSGLLRSLFARPDLRIHRKLLIIDGAVAYTGSLNLADPRFFKRSAGVGAWVDAFCRVQGPALRSLSLVFGTDWSVETRADPVAIGRELPFADCAESRRALIQCLPSGPAIKNSAIEEVLLMAIYSARRELVLTTPYFVPSESLLYALLAAAHRGVRVVLIVPERVDSRLTQYASRAFLRELAQAGVHVGLYQGGMLHTKSVVVDGIISLFGSLNLDPRSLRINFEITLCVYDEAFAGELGSLQRKYFAHSRALDLTATATGKFLPQLKEDLARLAAPLL